MSEQRRLRRTAKVAQQATALFTDVEILAVRSADDGLIYASLSHLCRALGLDTASQLERIEEHVVLSEGLCEFDATSNGRVLTTVCLKSNLLALWLALIPVKRLKKENQERILLFQRQVADVLDRLFGPGPDSSTLVSASSDEPPYAEGIAIARLASEQAQMAIQRVETSEAKLANFEAAVEARLVALEARLMPREQISEEQAERISD